DFKMLFIANVVTSLKHHVFKEVSKSRLSNFFTSRTYVVGHIYVYNRVAMIFMNDQGKPIGQHILFIRDNQLVSLLFYFLNKLSLTINQKWNDQYKACNNSVELFHTVFLIFRMTKYAKNMMFSKRNYRIG